jgi:hypothetical protein
MYIFLPPLRVFSGCNNRNILLTNEIEGTKEKNDQLKNLAKLVNLYIIKMNSKFVVFFVISVENIKIKHKNKNYILRKPARRKHTNLNRFS